MGTGMPSISEPELPWARVALAGAVFGLLVHWRVFPVLYGPCLMTYLHKKTAPMPGRGTSHTLHWLLACLAFGLPALAIFGGLGAFFFFKFGGEFLYEAFWYHASRHDPRHNFSPHFLFTYLHRFSTSAPHVPLWLNPSLAALPCMGAVTLAIAARFRRQLDVALLLTTMVFVTFNKVSTAQYFVWYIGLLPVISLELYQGWGLLQSASAVLWIISQLTWLGAAYLLEFKVCPFTLTRIH
jgi:GPI mannosyltransferase 1 subunit M